jgi:hypothetical protein
MSNNVNRLRVTHQITEALIPPDAAIPRLDPVSAGRDWLLPGSPIQQ